MHFISSILRQRESIILQPSRSFEINSHFFSWAQSVEQGFSVNKSLLVPKLQKESLTSQCVIYDHMNVTYLNARKIFLSPTLHRNVKEDAFLEKQKKNKETEKSRKWKLTEEEATELKRKKRLLVNTLSELHEEVDVYEYQVENEQKIRIYESTIS